MSEERKCALHGDQAESWCLYHIELMCVKCKFDDRHNQCPKDTIPARTEFPITEFDKMNLHQKCRDIYTTALKVTNETSSFSKNDPRKVLENLDLIFRTLGDRMKLLHEDATKSVHDTKEMCLNNCTEFQATAGTVLTDIGKLMKELCEDTVDVARIEKLAKDYKDEADTKLKNLEMCDMKYCIGLRIACLLDPENIATLRQAILESTLVESIFPQVMSTKSDIRFIQTLETKVNISEKTPAITGCTVLYTGTIVLIDSANSSIKLFSESGSFQNEIKTDSPPFDIARTELGICVSFPQLSQIRFYTDLASVMDDKSTRINMKNGKCFGVEYGGGKLVVSCQTAVSALFGFHNWWFCVFNKDGELTQVIEKDKHGNSFDMREGYFSYCPYRDQILFLASNGKAKQFQITGPSVLEHLSLLDIKNYKMSTLILSGKTLIACHRKYKFLRTNKTVIYLMGSGKTWEMEKKFNGENSGPISCDVRSRTIVVCEKLKLLDDRSKTVHVYKF